MRPDRTGARGAPDAGRTGRPAREGVHDQTPALRHLHPRLHRRRSRTGLQFSRRPAGIRRGLYQESGPRGMASRADRLRSNALLIGKLFNAAGERLSPTHAVKNGVRYRYYISTSAMQGRDRAASASHRLPAPALEAAVVEALLPAIEKQTSEPGETDDAFAAEARSRDGGKEAAGSLSQPAPPRHFSPTSEARSLIEAYLDRVVVYSARLQIDYRVDLGDPHAIETLTAPWTKPETHVRRALLNPISPGGQSRAMEGEERDRLILAIATGRSWLDDIIKGKVSDVAKLAARYDRTQRSVRMMLSLALLDPALIDAACCGTLPRGHGVTRMMDLPPRFADQWRALGLRRPV